MSAASLWKIDFWFVIYGIITRKSIITHFPQKNMSELLIVDSHQYSRMHVEPLQRLTRTHITHVAHDNLPQ